SSGLNGGSRGPAPPRECPRASGAAGPSPVAPGGPLRPEAVERRYEASGARRAPDLLKEEQGRGPATLWIDGLGRAGGALATSDVSTKQAERVEAASALVVVQVAVPKGGVAIPLPKTRRARNSPSAAANPGESGVARPGGAGCRGSPDGTP